MAPIVAVAYAIDYVWTAVRSFAEVAQLVEHATENCGVPSSSLGLGTIVSFPGLRLGQHSGIV